MTVDNCAYDDKFRINLSIAHEVFWLFIINKRNHTHNQDHKITKKKSVNLPSNLGVKIHP